MQELDLVFMPIKVYCRRCGERVTVSLEELSDNDEAVCPECGFAFLPNVDVDRFLRLMNHAEQTINKQRLRPADGEQP